LGLTADENGYPEDTDVATFYREVLRRIDELPGVESVTAMGSLPRSQDNPRTQFTIDGRPSPSPTEAPRTGWQSISDDYFATLGVAIVDGRAVGSTDRADAAPVIVVNESFARLQFPGQSALGQRVTIWGASREIVGVCADFPQSRFPEVDGIPPAVYIPFEQHPIRTASLATRVVGDPMALAPAVRQAVWAVDPDQPVDLVQTLRHHIESTLSGPRVISQALRTMGAVALLLSAIGMYGLIAHDVGQRRREIGIRMALGAAPLRVIGAVTLRGLGIAGLGMTLGVPAAWAMKRAIAAAFQGLVQLELRSIALVVVLLGLVALVASYVPAVRAARIRPARVLQSE
jgi:putative ABC transport system permease protein